MSRYYAPKDKFLWDFWIIRHRNTYHMYYLQAPRNLPNPERRHQIASVGHATSKNLIDWEEQSTVLAAGEKGSWDDICIWTGSVAEKDNQFFMLYTGRNRGSPHVQKIGLAFSDDLFMWEKYEENPIIEADSRWYQTVKDFPSSMEAWRDPYIYYDTTAGLHYAFITATTKTGNSNHRGCIGLACSENLYTWEVLPPFCSPGLYEEMECPQLLYRHNKYYLIFSTWTKGYSEQWARQIGGGQSGTHAFVSDKLMGSYCPVGNGIILGTESNCYGTRIMKDPNNNDIALSWIIKTRTEPMFAGRLSYPMQVVFTSKGIEIKWKHSRDNS